MEQTQKQTLSDFQEEVLEKRSKRKKRIWKDFYSLVILYVMIAIVLGMLPNQHVFMSAFIGTVFFAIILFSIWLAQRMYKNLDRQQIMSLEKRHQSLKDEKKKTSENVLMGESFGMSFLIKIPNAIEIKADPDLRKQFNAYADLESLRKLLFDQVDELILLEQKINWLKNWPWELITWEQKRAIYAILLNIIILGAVWVFIPWLWVCIVLSIIIPVIGFVIFVLWGMFRFACVQNPFGALFNLYMFKIK
jgi:hypothetical protein